MSSKIKLLCLGVIVLSSSASVASAQFASVSVGGFYPGVSVVAPGVSVGVGSGFGYRGAYAGVGYGPSVAISTSPHYYIPSPYVVARPYVYSRPGPVFGYRRAGRFYRGW